MENDHKPKVVSFVIRFVQENSEIKPGRVSYRGAIRHVQTDEEILFTCWSDAVNFIQQLVPIQSMIKEDE